MLAHWMWSILRAYYNGDDTKSEWEGRVRLHKIRRLERQGQLDAAAASVMMGNKLTTMILPAMVEAALKDGLKS